MKEFRSPADLAVRKAIGTLAKRHIRNTKERVIFLDSDLHEVETVPRTEIVRGVHLKKREELLSQAKLRVVAHLGLARRGQPTVYVHIVDAGATEDVEPYKLFAVRQTNNRIQWVRPTDAAERAWQRRWPLDQ